MSASKSILLDAENRIAVITLDDPQKLNALTEEMLRALYDTLCQCERDPDIAAVIITGSGRGFCSGANLTSSILDRRGKGFAQWIEDNLNPVVQKIQSMPVPVMAAVNGPAAGAGFSLAIGCDLLIAGQSAKFVLGFGKIGVAMDLGASWMLMRAIGSKRANQLAMLGKPLDVDTATEWGLVMEVTPDANLLTRAKEICEEMIENATQAALGAMKKQFTLAATSDLQDALTYEAEVQAELVLTPESRSRIEAFIKK